MLWGSIYVCNKMLLDTVPGFTLLCLRYCIAAVVMLSFLAIQKKRGAHITGMVLSMDSALSWGIVSVCARPLTKKYDALTITTYGICIAVIATLPLMIWERYHSAGYLFLQPKYIILILTYGVHSPAKIIL